jgi:hypothetical protein
MMAIQSTRTLIVAWVWDLTFESRENMDLPRLHTPNTSRALWGYTIVSSLHYNFAVSLSVPTFRRS